MPCVAQGRADHSAAGVSYGTQRTAEGSVLGAVSLCFFCLCVKYLGEPLNGFAPDSHGRRVWSLDQTNFKVKGDGQGHRDKKRHFSAACVRFTFGKTTLACSLVCLLPDLVFPVSFVHSQSIKERFPRVTFDPHLRT